jgi:hypothetical protein
MRRIDPSTGLSASEDETVYALASRPQEDESGIPRLQIRPLVWSANDWPLAGRPYDGPPSSTGGTPDVLGNWGHSVDFAVPYQIQFAADGTIKRCNSDRTWSLNGTQLTLQWPSADGSGTTQVDECVVSSEGPGTSAGTRMT